MTESIFSTSTREYQSLISYEEFGNWYNAGGYTVAPWLELLDLSKWPGMGAVVNRQPSAQSADDTESDHEDESGALWIASTLCRGLR